MERFSFCNPLRKSYKQSLFVYTNQCRNRTPSSMQVQRFNHIPIRFSLCHRSSQSSSGSDSSGSSSDSSDSSYSSSSSAEVRRRKISSPIGRKDLKKALELSTTKLKMSLKAQQQAVSPKKSDRSALMAGKKRSADSPTSALDKASAAAAAAKAAKKASTRREELLKQLKAVEDAIARKRSKV